MVPNVGDQFHFSGGHWDRLKTSGCKVYLNQGISILFLSSLFESKDLYLKTWGAISNLQVIRWGMGKKGLGTTGLYSRPSDGRLTREESGACIGGRRTRRRSRASKAGGIQSVKLQKLHFFNSATSCFFVL